MIDIEVLLKKIYGREKFYPSNDNAQTLCDLLHSITLTKDQLKYLKDRGWKIIIKTEEYKLE